MAISGSCNEGTCILDFDRASLLELANKVDDLKTGTLIVQLALKLHAESLSQNSLSGLRIITNHDNDIVIFQDGDILCISGPAKKINVLAKNLTFLSRQPNTKGSLALIFI